MEIKGQGNTITITVKGEEVVRWTQPAGWQTNYVSEQLYNRAFDIEARDILEVGSSTTHDLSANFAVTGNLKMWLAVTNLFDAAPPFPIGPEAFNGNYDFLGRRYSLSVAYDFGK